MRGSKKPTIDVGLLRELTKIAKVIKMREERKFQTEEARKIERAAQDLADSIIEALPERLLKAAREGEWSLDIFGPIMDEVSEKAAQLIKDYCVSQNLYCDRRVTEYPGSKPDYHYLIAMWDDLVNCD